MARQKLIHLHGSEQLTKAKATAVNMVAGELAVMNGTKETSELYVLTTGGDVATFVTGAKGGYQIDGDITSLKNSDIKDLSDRIVAFEEGANSVESQIESAITELTGANGQVGKNTAAIATLTQDLGELSGEFSEYQTANDEAVAEAKKAGDDAAAALGTYKTSNDARVKAVEDDLAGYKTTNNAAVAEAKQAGTDAAAALGTYKTSNDARVKAVEDDLAGYKTTNDAAVAEAKKAGTDAAAALEAYKTEHDTEYAEFKAANTEAIATAKKAGTDAAAALDTHKNDKNVHVSAELQEKWNTTSERLETFLGGDTLQDTLDTLHGIQEWMEADGKDASEILGAITQEVADRKAADEGLSARIAAFEEGANSVESQIESAITELTGANGQVGKNTAAIGTLSNDLSELSEDFSEYQATNNAAVAEAKKAGTDAADALEAYETANDARVKAVEDDLAGYKTSNDARVKAVEDDLAGYKTTNNAAVAEAKKAGTDAAAALETYKTAHDTEYAAFKQSNSQAIATAKQAGDDAAAALGTYKTANDARVKTIEDTFVKSGEIKGANNQVINGTVTNNKLSFDITGLVIDCGTY